MGTLKQRQSFLLLHKQFSLVSFLYHTLKTLLLLFYFISINYKELENFKIASDYPLMITRVFSILLGFSLHNTSSTTVVKKISLFIMKRTRVHAT